MKRVVVMAMPSRAGQVHVGSAFALAKTASRREMDAIVLSESSSLLTHNFNTMWVRALNVRKAQGVTHFVMLHDDVVPDGKDQFWLDTLMDELDEQDADLVSAVVPIKSEHGLTSTGLSVADDPWHVRRLSMTEVFDLPETFGTEDVQHLMPDCELVTNTGCWVMRFDDWIFDLGLTFRQQDQIVWDRGSCQYSAEAISEDWDFARQLTAGGKKVMATRKVELFHGLPVYHNKSPWGDCTTDEQYAEYLTRKNNTPELAMAG